MAEQLWEIQRQAGWTDEQLCAIPYARLIEIIAAAAKRAYREERQQLKAAAYTAFLLGAGGKGGTWGTFVQRLGLDEEAVPIKPVDPEEIEQLKEEAEAIADRAIAGYLGAKKKYEARVAAQRVADSHKRKGPEPEELRERLRAIRESIGESKSGSH